MKSFPTLNLSNPEVYIAELCALLMRYPVWIGEKAIETAKDSFKWPPTRAELKPLLEDLARMPRYAIEWENGARRQLLELAAPIEQKPTLEEMKERYGENWGLASLEEPRHKSKPAPSWDKITADYSADPGRITRLADACAIHRGEIPSPPTQQAAE